MNRMKTSVQSRTTICKTHMDQELAYLCEECKALICSECVVHGIHRSHRVHAFNKATGFVLEKVNEGTKDLVARMASITRTNEILENVKSDILNKWKNLKKNISSEFEDIINLLIQKREAVERDLDEFMREETRELEEMHEKNMLSLVSLKSICEGIKVKAGTSQKFDLLEFYIGTFPIYMKSAQTEIETKLNNDTYERIDRIDSHAKNLVAQFKPITDKITSLSSINTEMVKSASPKKTENKDDIYGTVDFRELGSCVRSPLSAAKSKTIQKLERMTSPSGKRPLNSLSTLRGKKIAASPSYLKYLQHKKTLF